MYPEADANHASKRELCHALSSHINGGRISVKMPQQSAEVSWKFEWDFQHPLQSPHQDVLYHRDARMWWQVNPNQPSEGDCRFTQWTARDEHVAVAWRPCDLKILPGSLWQQAWCMNWRSPRRKMVVGMMQHWYESKTSAHHILTWRILALLQHKLLHILLQHQVKRITGVKL